MNIAFMLSEVSDNPGLPYRRRPSPGGHRPRRRRRSSTHSGLGSRSASIFGVAERRFINDLFGTHTTVVTNKYCLAIASVWHERGTNRRRPCLASICSSAVSRRRLTGVAVGAVDHDRASSATKPRATARLTMHSRIHRISTPVR